MFLVDFLKYIYECIFNVIGNHGFSIIMLSLAITILMLPLFLFADFLQNKEQQRKDAMQADIDQLADVANKQEKYFYTQEIYRKHNYNPFYALTGLVGLLIQVPFFLAAYWFLIEYDVLAGISFGPISDLFKPDGLIEIGTIKINILPFVMTVVNLIAGFLYIKNNDKAAKVQLIVIALVFLVLLYELSSALVLYWTFNNVFSIGKSWLLSKIDFNKSEKFPIKQLSKFTDFSLKTFNNNNYLIPVLLFSIIPLLSIYLTNIGELKLKQISSILIVILISTFCVLALMKKIFKQENKVVLFGVVSILVFFSFGHVRELFSASTLLTLILLLLYGLILLGALIFFIKYQKKLRTLTKTFNIISLFIFVSIVLRIVAFNLSSNHTIIASDQLINKETSKSLVSENKKYPDIYYLILDGYANEKILNTVQKFDNSPFLNQLEDRGFYVAEDATCNYMATFLSLAATLNMGYVTHLKEDLGAAETNREVPYQMIADNKVQRYLKNKGYCSMHVSSGWGGTNVNEFADSNYAVEKALNEFNITFLQTTLLRPMLNHLVYSDYSGVVLYPFEQIPNLIPLKSPKFVFSHIVSPHPPYFFDEFGDKVKSEIKLNNNWDTDQIPYYIDQLKFLNNKTMTLIDEILAQSEDAIVIIQSDHGSAFLGNKDWSNPTNQFLHERGRILNAIRMPESDSTQLYSSISSVNTFRVLFNTIFDDDFELLNDSTYFSSYTRPYDFKNVTQILDSTSLESSSLSKQN